MTATISEPQTVPVTGSRALHILEHGNVQGKMRRLFHQLRPGKSTDFLELESLASRVRDTEILEVVTPLVEKLQEKHDKAVAAHDAFYLSIDFDRLALAALVSRVHSCAEQSKDAALRDRFRASIAIDWATAPRAEIFGFLRAALDAGVLPASISEWPDTVVLMLYPRSCAHIICGSLGYACAAKAARMLSAAHDSRPAYNEWAYDYACRSYKKQIESGRSCGRWEGHEGECRFRSWGDPDDSDWLTPKPNGEAVCCGRREMIPNPVPFAQHEIDATRTLVRNCVHSPAYSMRRPRHSGYMADYRSGLVVVAREIVGRTPQPNFAAWF